MCQYTSRCPVGTHRPGTICRYAAVQGGGAVVAVGAALFFGLPAVGIDMPSLTDITSHTKTQTATVTRVIDGDTITARAQDGTNLGRVRLLGIDAPELDTNDCGAADARDAAHDLLAGKTVQLVTDPKNDDRDVYGRLLRYVDLDDTDAGQELIRGGHVHVTAKQDSHTRHNTYTRSGTRARAAHRGLWANCRP